MPSERVVATVIAKNHTAHARVLAHSLRRNHPDLRLVVLLFDEVEGRLDPAGEPFELIAMDAIDAERLRLLAFRYDVRLGASAAKPHLLRHLLDRGHRQALFVDADTFLTAPLDPLFAALEDHDVVLTPHILGRAADAGAPERERLLLTTGTLNAGVVGVRDGTVAQAMLRWWGDRLDAHAGIRPERGEHADQRWLDLATTLFDGVALLRDPGINVAYWNLHERRLRIAAGRLMAGDRPCRLLHASGYDPAAPRQLSVYAPHAVADPVVAGLLECYAAKLHAAGQATVSLWPYAFATYADGAPIPSEHREAHRALGDGAAARFGDPFAVGPGSFRAWADAGGDAAPGAGPR